MEIKQIKKRLLKGKEEWKKERRTGRGREIRIENEKIHRKG